MSATTPKVEASVPVHETNTRPRMNWEFNPTNLLGILVAAVGLTAFTLTMNAKTESTAAAVVALDGRMVAGFADVSRRIDDLTRAVTPIATLALRVTEAERRLTEQDARDNTQDQRLGRQAEDIAAIRERLNIEARPGRRVTP